MQLTTLQSDKYHLRNTKSEFQMGFECTGPKRSLWKDISNHPQCCDLRPESVSLRKVSCYVKRSEKFVLYSYVGVNFVECVPLFVPAFAVLFFSAH